MKRGFLIAVFLVLVSLNTACVIRDASISPDERINGSGNLITETRNLSDIHSVNMATAGNVNVTYGTEQQITVTVEDNIMEHIHTTVSGGELFIGTARNVTISNMHLTVNITMTDLKALATSSAGAIEGQNKFEADEVSLILSSAGNAQVYASQALDVTISSIGSVFFKGNPTITQRITSLGRLYDAN